jgi:hypothetical protein
MSNAAEEIRVHFLELPVEIHLEIVKQLAAFQGDHARVACTRPLKDIRL